MGKLRHREVKNAQDHTINKWPSWDSDLGTLDPCSGFVPSIRQGTLPAFCYKFCILSSTLVPGFSLQSLHGQESHVACPYPIYPKTFTP